MTDNLVLDGDFQQADGGLWTCGPGCKHNPSNVEADLNIILGAMQAQRPCTGRCAILHPPQTLSQLINIEETQIAQNLCVPSLYPNGISNLAIRNFTAQVLATSTTLNSKTKQVDVLVSFGNSTIEHSFSIYPALEIGGISHA
jgi:hypothetical protein